MIRRVGFGMRIDLDSHIISRPSPKVLQKMHTLYRDRWGALDAPHRKGIELYPDVESALRILCRSFEADGYYFQLTSGGISAMRDLFFQFYLREARETGKTHFLSTVIEEAPILKGLTCMEQMGCALKLLPVKKSGQIDLQQLEEALRPKTALFSFSAVCALTGVLQPVAEIIEICHAKKVKVHLNVTHAITSLPISFKEWNADYVTFDGDKIGTPQGIGALFSNHLLKDGMKMAIPLIGLAEAIHEMGLKKEQFGMEMARLRLLFEEELLRAIPDAIVIGAEVERAPHIFAVAFPGIINEAILYDLYCNNVEASIGGGEFQTLTTLLQACSYANEVASSAISFACPPDIQEDELAQALSVIVTTVRKLKKMRSAL